MSEPKAFASLSSGLLARKGAAKPAMRPQGFGQMGGMGMEDLGWNDMGTPSHAPASVHPIQPQELPEHVPSSISALTPAPKNGQAAEPQPQEAVEEIVEASPPPVVEQQRAIEASFAEPAPVVEAAKPVEAAVVKLPPRPRQARGSKAKAAFTLRLDAERHLKLRLACAVTHKSAQQIVSRALEDYLASLPELDVLASKVPSKRGNA